MPKKQEEPRRENEPIQPKSYIFDQVVDLATEKFLSWNAYDDLRSDTESRGMWMVFQDVGNPYFALGCAVGVVVRETCEEGQLPDLFRATFFEMKKNGQENKMRNLLDLANTFNANLPPTTPQGDQIRKAALKKVLALISDQIMDTLLQDSDIGALVIQRWAEYMGPKIEGFI